MAYNLNQIRTGTSEHIADALSRLVDKTHHENRDSQESEDYARLGTREATPRSMST